MEPSERAGREGRAAGAAPLRGEGADRAAQRDERGEARAGAGGERDGGEAWSGGRPGGEAVSEEMMASKALGGELSRGGRRRGVGWVVRPVRFIGRVAVGMVKVLLIAWATLAVYHLTLPWPWVNLIGAAAFAAAGVWALWIKRPRPMGWLLFAILFGAVVGWFMSIRPSHDRDWRPEVAVLPRVVIDGDNVRITGVRNFHFRSASDFDIRYEERSFSLAHVASVDLFISFWMPGPVGHTFVSFNFDDGTPPLCISIEVRPEVGEGFAPVASMFKRFELIYVVGDEQDIVGVRATHRDEDVFLYPIRATPAGARRLLEIYLERINELADEPEFYHLLKNSCTINIVRYANRAGRQGRLDIRHLLNGLADRYLYDAGLVETDLPFHELRRRSRITEAAIAADGAPDFSQRIRANLPGRDRADKAALEAAGEAR